MIMEMCDDNDDITFFTLYTVPKAPLPMMLPFRSSDSLIKRKLAISGLAAVGVSGCK